jgi:hypothetical protein
VAVAERLTHHGSEGTLAPVLRPARVAGLLIVALLALSGCGGKPDAEQVRDTVTAFRDATAKQDYDRICRRILAPSLVARLSQLGVPCQLALSKYLKGTERPTLDVSRVVLHGASAQAYVTASARNQAKTLSIVRLVKVKDGWRISSLAAPG